MLIRSKHITAYIDYLLSTGLYITLHGQMVESSKSFLVYNYHQNPFCHSVKTIFGTWKECVCKQEKVFQKCKDGSFFGCCYAGVGEYVYPVMRDNEVCGFISVSGYMNEKSLERGRKYEAKYELERGRIETLMERYLSRFIPEKARIDALVEPLVFMLEAYLNRSTVDIDNETRLYHAMLVYVTENCHNRITMQELSERYHYSVSTLSHLFSKNAGKSLPEYLDDLRLKEAKWYLTSGELSVAEIAAFLGYSSSNYFSTVFKKKFGVTPKAFSKKAKAAQTLIKS